jgi:hypothetical protein
MFFTTKEILQFIAGFLAPDSSILPFVLSNPPLFTDLFNDEELEKDLDWRDLDRMLGFEFCKLEIKLSPEGNYESIDSDEKFAGQKRRRRSLIGQGFGWRFGLIITDV